MDLIEKYTLSKSNKINSVDELYKLHNKYVEKEKFDSLKTLDFKKLFINNTKLNVFVLDELEKKYNVRMCDIPSYIEIKREYSDNIFSILKYLINNGYIESKELEFGGMCFVNKFKSASFTPSDRFTNFQNIILSIFSYKCIKDLKKYKNEWLDFIIFLDDYI